MNKHPEMREKTRRGIIDAFWRMTASPEKATVISVSKAAGVNRSTFYQYFCDIYELEEKARLQALIDVKEKLMQAFPQGFPNSLVDFAKIYAQVLEDEGERFFYILSSAPDKGLMKQLEDFSAPIFARLFGLDPEMIGFDFAISFIVSAVTGLVSKWYKEGKPISLDELLYDIYWLLSTGIAGFSQMKPYNG